MITIYTDGSSRGNPGPGGYGVLMVSGKHRKEFSEGFRHTTNNRMELLSVIVALETIKDEGQEVLVFSDSQYVVFAVEKGWVFNWKKKNFKDKKNPDLWQRFLNIYPKHKKTISYFVGPYLEMGQFSYDLYQNNPNGYGPSTSYRYNDGIYYACYINNGFEVLISKDFSFSFCGGPGLIRNIMPSYNSSNGIYSNDSELGVSMTAEMNLSYRF